jgi:hypothetical protein
MWVVAVVAGLLIVAVAVVLIWSPWRDAAPQPPQSVHVDSTESELVRLQWDPPGDGPSAESYAIIQGDEQVGSVEPPVTAFLVTALTPNTRYEFAVVSVVGDQRSEPSAALVVTTDPGMPSSLRIDDQTATSVRLQWEAPSGPDVDSYVILNDGDELGLVSHPETSFSISDLIPGASYDFAVAAEAGRRRSIPATTTATTTAPSPAELMSDPAMTTTDTIVLTWAPPPGAGAPTEYIIVRDGETVATLPGDTLSHTDTGLAPATPYDYQVAADWGYEPSEPTDVIVVPTAEPPVADARLVGPWPVDITLVEEPGGNLEAGTTWNTTWDIEPACDGGACDVTLFGGFSPPGYVYQDFTIGLTRDGASYAGSTTAQITNCVGVAVENTVTVRLTVDAAGVQEGTWVANSLTGTLEISSPYTEVGAQYCPAQVVVAGFTATT